MPNYGVFTQICVLQEFRENKLKRKKKQQMGLKMRVVVDLAKASSANCRNSVATILRGKWQKECRDKAK